MKINLCETNLDGHHEIYLENLLNISSTSKLFIDIKIEGNKKRIFNYIFDRKKLIKKFLSKDNEIFHLLYFDMIYTYFPLSSLNINKIILGTLHFVPEEKLKIILLKNFSKKIDLIVVHSEILKEKLLKIGIKNVEVVHYPSFYDYSIIEPKEKLKKKFKLEDKIVLTTLGGTRNDKGLDILLESFKYLNSELKERIILNIAGKEETFKKEFIVQKSKENKINIRGKYGFLTDEEFMENVLLTDVMVMPYRKIFGGNSGPMTEAIVNKIPCITPKGLNIGDLTEKYDLGLTFECENPKSLAETIEKMILNKEKNEFFTSDYHKKLTVENFLRSYEEIYSKLEKGEYK
ncbi:glycosyltransferase [Cetobacterium somerae]|uniref:glycosyltransferase n=1 Tax=Cetobacterium sp. NK01 TaxID=2993530 RepID=UPI00211640C3|nr:glycosyltransferase [Cetobacterium sp. NK01]MCQ8213242.1 glycosyltransferase [Cetobacterium sp. NK01]